MLKSKDIIKHFLYTLFLFSVSSATFSQDNLNFKKLPNATQNVFTQIASNYHTGPVDYHSLENDLKKSGIDFSQMPIEDAIMMMFMLIADDARKDMKEMLKDMEATRQKKAGMRQSEELMKQQRDSLKKKMATQNRPDSLRTANALTQKNLQLQQNHLQQKESLILDTKAEAAKTTAEIHLHSAEDAIVKLQQTRSRKKPQ